MCVEGERRETKELLLTDQTYRGKRKGKRRGEEEEEQRRSFGH